MEREYEMFELLPDGSPVWRAHASGLREVRMKLEQIGKSTTNECFAIYLSTKEIVARVNVGTSRANGKPVVFQIYYHDSMATARAEILRLHGYEVVSAAGNEAARVILSLPQRCDIFIVGHAAPEESRKEIVAWLKAKYPGIRIIALNSPTIRELPGADYNIELNGPQTWLPVIDKALRESHASGPSPNS